MRRHGLRQQRELRLRHLPPEREQPAHQLRRHLEQLQLPQQRLAAGGQRLGQRRPQHLLPGRLEHRSRGVQREAGAPSNAFDVDDAGNLGLGTTTPVVEIHVKDGDTPTLRLEQDNSSGFTAQTWDIAGNETNFFVRDVTNGSKLAFRIRPGAPESSIDIAASGNVGMGTASPSSSLHILRGNSGSAKLTVEDTAGDTILNAFELKNAGEVRFAMEDTSATSRRWEFRTTGPNFQFTRSDAPAADMLIDNSGNMSIRGNLTVGGGSCTGCDLVFSPEYKVESIQEHAASMWANSYLPGVGPTPEDAPMNLGKKTAGILNELEKAHIYIEQLDQLNRQLEAQQAELQQQVAQLRSTVEQLSNN